MPSQFDVFTENLRETLCAAQRHVLARNGHEIGTGDLLAGLLRAGGIGQAALARLGRRVMRVVEPQARSQLWLEVDEGTWDGGDEVQLGPLMKQAIEYAINEAHKSGDHLIGTGHRLIGLRRMDSGDAKHILDEAGVELDELRPSVREVGAAKQSPKAPERLRLEFRVRAFLQSFGI